MFSDSISGECKAKSERPVLRRGEGGIALVGKGMELRGDFTRMLRRIKPGNLKSELLVKAARLKNSGSLTAVDATAGLGEDSLILAAAGFYVKMCEYNATIAALLGDALVRARSEPELREIAARMELIEGDSISVLENMDTAPDLVFLDPMFPAKQKNSLSEKKMQIFQMLELPCADEEKLLRAAIGANPRKVVIKRPLKSAFMAGIKPDYSIKGKKIRYDCICVK